MHYSVCEFWLQEAIDFRRLSADEGRIAPNACNYAIKISSEIGWHLRGELSMSIGRCCLFP